MLAKGTPFWIFVLPIGAIFFLLLSIILPHYQITSFITGMMLISLFIPVSLFFRDPGREICDGIISPADGRVLFVEKNEKTDEYHVAIFMNVHNVHVNRAPLAGKVLKVEHLEGKFVPAFNKESENNERTITTIDTEIGEMKVIQIAGLIARRIVSYVKPGKYLRTGERFGMIRFGSRVDIIFSSNGAKPTVEPGKKLLAGSDRIAILKHKE